MTLKWEDPSSLLTKSKMIRFDEGKSDDAIGVTEGGFFYAGIALDADDLAPYRGMHLLRNTLQRSLSTSTRTASAYSLRVLATT